MSDEGRLVAGRYRIIRRIGTGAMGAVWQAQDEVLHRTVAIKQLLLQPGLEQNAAEDARQRTMREGRIAARLHHPNAITVFDVVTDDNSQPCLIMEYLRSTSLAAVLQERKTLPPLEVAHIGAQVAAALREAHAVGIVHRDIKPGNILLTSGGLVKITDFGISRAKDDVTVTRTGMIAGTPAYLAPEVAIGGNPGPESDVFSLGSTLYAACEGQPPFGLSENTLGLLHAVAAGQINPPRQSGPLTSVLAVLLHPDVRHRPTAAEAEELLVAVSKGQTPLGAPIAGTAASAGMLGAPDSGTSHSTPQHGTALYSDGLADGFTDADTPTEVFQRGFYDDADYPNAGPGHNPEDPANNPEDRTERYRRDDPDDYAGYPVDDYDHEPAAVPAARREDDPDVVRRRDAAHDDAGSWKKPAAIGGIVLVALVALGVWAFSSRTGGEATQEPGQTSVPAASSPNTGLNSDPESTTESSTETTSPTTSSTSGGPNLPNLPLPPLPPPIGGGNGGKPSTSAPEETSTKETTTTSEPPPDPPSSTAPSSSN